MPTFSSRNQSTAIVPAKRQDIWALLCDADSLAALTPLVKGITANGDEWCWNLAGISALGVTVAPTFTEHMTLVEGERIEFRHDPPGRNERAGANGTYELADAPGGTTKLYIDITICVELPLPRLSRRAVEGVMATTMTKTGDRFARNLYEKLGLDPADATKSVVTS